MSTIIPFEMYCPIESFSHRVKQEAFEILDPDQTHLSVTDVKEHSFFLRVRNIVPDVQTLHHFSSVGHTVISNFIMALNVATLGNFIWAGRDYHFPKYSFLDPTHPKRVRTLRCQNNPRAEYEKQGLRDLTKEEVNRATKLWPAFVREKERHIREEYIKGVYLFGVDIYEFNFYKEAFMEFYRSFEYLVTTRVLQVPKLTSELKQFQQALSSLGFGDRMVDTIRDIYQLRCQQVMHAQKEQKDIEWNDVAVMKAFLDAMLLKVYEPIADGLFGELED